MQGLNTIGSLIAGGFILTVVVNGNTKKMIELAKRDKAFLKWFIAVLILLYFQKSKILGKDFTLIITMAFIGLFVSQGKKISDGFEKFWSYLGK